MPWGSGVLGGVDMIDSKFMEQVMSRKGAAVIVAGSYSDASHIENIITELDRFDIPFIVRICSAHKQPSKAEAMVKEYNELFAGYPLAYISIADGTDALSGMLSWHALHPVISSPPKELHVSVLDNPPGSSNAYCKNTDDIALHLAQMFQRDLSSVSSPLSGELPSDLSEKAKSLLEAAAKSGGVFLMSGNQLEILGRVAKELKPYGITAMEAPYQTYWDIFRHMNLAKKPIAFVYVAGSGSADFENWIASENWHPSVTLIGRDTDASAFIRRPENAARYIAQIFAFSDPSIANIIAAENKSKVAKLEEKDIEFMAKYVPKGGK